MHSRHLMLIGIFAVVLSLAAVQALAQPQYGLWSMSITGYGSRHMNQGNGCNMNGQGMMGNTMNGQMVRQQCQHIMGPNGAQMMNDQNHQQYCSQFMGPGQDVTAAQCQAMYQYCHN